MTKISRREALGTAGRAAVAVLAGGGVSLAGSDDDAELLRLEAEVNAARARWDDLNGVWNAIQQKVFDARPPAPQSDLSSMPAEIRARFAQITGGELDTIQQVAPDHPFSVWMREHGGDEEAAYARWHAEKERVAEEFGEPEADAAQSAQHDRAMELSNELLSVRAASLIGIMVKVRLREWMDYPEGAEAILDSLEDDLRAWAGEPPRETEAEGNADV